MGRGGVVPPLRAPRTTQPTEINSRPARGRGTAQAVAVLAAGGARGFAAFARELERSRATRATRATKAASLDDVLAAAVDEVKNAGSAPRVLAPSPPPPEPLIAAFYAPPGTSFEELRASGGGDAGRADDVTL